MHAASGSSDISPQPGGWAGVLGTFHNTSEPGGVRACVRMRVSMYLHVLWKCGCDPVAWKPCSLVRTARQGHGFADHSLYRLVDTQEEERAGPQPSGSRMFMETRCVLGPRVPPVSRPRGLCTGAQVWERQRLNHKRHTSYNLIPWSSGPWGLGVRVDGPGWVCGPLGHEPRYPGNWGPALP